MERVKIILTGEETRDMEALLSLTIPIAELDVPIASVPLQDGHVAEFSVIKQRNESEIHPSMTLCDADGTEIDWKNRTNPYGMWHMRTWYGKEYEIEVSKKED